MEEIMPENPYDNLDLTIKRMHGNCYQMEARRPDGTKISQDFENTFSKKDMDDFQQIINDFLANSRGGKRGPAKGSPGEEILVIERSASELKDRVKTFGERLCKMALKSDVETSLWQSYDSCKKNGRSLRIRICLDDAPELSKLPWEYIFYRKLNRHLACFNETPIVRFLHEPSTISSISINPPQNPLNILVMISAHPNGYAPLDADKEWKNIKEAFKELEVTGYVHLEMVDSATRIGLQYKLSERENWHVFHYIGHGDIDRKTKEPMLIFEGPVGKDEVYKDDLAVMLHKSNLRMVILNSCKGAQSEKSDPLASLALGLLHEEYIQVVIAMQSEISDDAAVLFSRTFYKNVANGHSADYAMSEARKSIFLANNPTEWGIPAIFMRSDNGLIFNINLPSDIQVKRAQIESLTTEAKNAIDLTQYDRAIKKLNKIIELTQG
jgi:hypothetical protein